MPDFPVLLDNLVAAASEHEHAKHQAGMASRLETVALNKLNDAQKALDAAMDQIRHDAARNTNWAQQRGGHHD